MTMKRSAIAFVLSACLATAAVGQTDKQPDNPAGRAALDAAVLQGVKAYTFTTSGGSGLARNERFCLPSDQKLIRVTEVTPSESNGKSTINVRPDIEKNCVDLDVLLPPAKSLCAKVPTIHGLKINFEERCAYIPTTVAFSVKYEAGSLPDVGDNPAVSVPPSPKQ